MRLLTAQVVQILLLGSEMNCVELKLFQSFHFLMVYIYKRTDKQQS